jgi:BlaI family penicillinase repressor
VSDNIPPKPTEGELELLQVLWERGPSTVREIHQGLSDDRDTGYTTTLKVLQKMMAKGLVQRDESTRSHVYSPTFEAEETRQQLAGDLMQRGFGGSASRLVLAALSAKRATSDELAEIRRLLDEMENQNGANK